jgi:single-strand DNA-binding protein
MSNDLNQCNFIGRLGSDPETRYMPNGDAVCSFRIAVGWKSKEKEGAEWVSITAFGKLAEICTTYLVKGSQVFVSGRFKTDEYEKDGIKRYSTKIIADRMQMLGGKPDSGQEKASGSYGRSDPDRQPAAKKAPSFDDMDDDIIPF